MREEVEGVSVKQSHAPQLIRRIKQERERERTRERMNINMNMKKGLLRPRVFQAVQFLTMPRFITPGHLPDHEARKIW